MQVAMQRGVRMYHDQTTRPLNDLRWELLTLLAHGAFVTIVDKTGFDGWLDPVAYERIGAAFREVQEMRAHFGQHPVREVGLYFSSRTRDWFGREKPSNYFQAFQGAHKAMVYEHIPWGVVLDENLTFESLKKFPVVMLPNVAVISEWEVALFRRYVEDGGKLIVTGRCGLRGRRGEMVQESALADLIGAKFIRELDSTDNWVRFEAAERSGPAREIVASVPPDWPFLVRGPGIIYQATTAASVGELMCPHRTSKHSENRYPADWPMSAATPVGPAVLVNTIGRGSVLTIAASPDSATASDHHTVESRRWLARAVRLLNPEPRIRIDAPATVQAVVTDDPVARKLRVHVLGYNSPPQTTPPKHRPYVLPTPIEDVPLFRVSIESNETLKGAEAARPSTRIDRRGNRVVATVEDVHDCLVLEY
jgi:hypothetical protein